MNQRFKPWSSTNRCEIIRWSDLSKHERLAMQGLSETPWTSYRWLRATKKTRCRQRLMRSVLMPHSAKSVLPCAMFTESTKNLRFSRADRLQISHVGSYPHCPHDLWPTETIIT